MSERTSYSIRIDPDLLAKIRHRADGKGLSVNEWIVRACAATLQRTTGEEIIFREVIL